MFDAYSRQARLQSALLALFPLFFSVAVWLPALYELVAGLVGLAVACGVTVAFAHVARVRGRTIEEQLFESWGGKPTTTWLRHRDDHLDEHTKARYCEFLGSNVRDWRGPTVEEERADPTEADARYETAVRWLLEYTRDRKRFPLVFKENVSYGFRRNLYGLQAIGLIVAIVCTIANVVALYIGAGDGGSTSAAGAAALGVSFAAIVGWLFVVKPAWVRDAGDAYAKALLAACDTHPVKEAT